ncbi:hypothetical protein C1I97_31640, partial [Streptomyces sp. NTH33]
CGQGGGSEGQGPPAAATATVPSRPVETYAQASAAAGAAGPPTHVQARTAGANTRSIRADRFGSGRCTPCTTEIMSSGGPGHAAVPVDCPEGGKWQVRGFDRPTGAPPWRGTRVRIGRNVPQVPERNPRRR